VRRIYICVSVFGLMLGACSSGHGTAAGRATDHQTSTARPKVTDATIVLRSDVTVSQRAAIEAAIVTNRTVKTVTSNDSAYSIEAQNFGAAPAAVRSLPTAPASIRLHLRRAVDASDLVSRYQHLAGVARVITSSRP
jgi:hypothetical protein